MSCTVWRPEVARNQGVGNELSKSQAWVPQSDEHGEKGPFPKRRLGPWNPCFLVPCESGECPLHQRYMAYSTNHPGLGQRLSETHIRELLAVIKKTASRAPQKLQSGHGDSGYFQHMGMGLNVSPWTAGFSPCFHLLGQPIWGTHFRPTPMSFQWTQYWPLAVVLFGVIGIS